MSLFGSILSKIFHPHAAQAQAAAPAAAPVQAAPTPAASPAASPEPAAPAAAQAPAEPVDVEAVLSDMERQKGAPLNWRSSIVDLLKLLDLDSSLSAREGLARELGYGGAMDGSAEMNIWLHKAVMRKLQENGGKVPASMTS